MRRCYLPVCEMSLKILVSDNYKQSLSDDVNMNSYEMLRENEFRSKVFEQIISGSYPSKDVGRMSLIYLENLVLRLLQFTSLKLGAKAKVYPELTNWQEFTEVKVEKPDNVSKKEFRVNLEKVVVNCCDFFKGFRQKWLPQNQAWINDENFNFDQVQAGKRKANEALDIQPRKKKKTLPLRVNKDLLDRLQINIARLAPPVHPSSEQPLCQAEFLQGFQLNLNCNEIPKATQAPNSSRIIRLQNCPHVPFSSNVGQILLARGNLSVPADTIERKIEKLEWYINREPPKIIPTNYQVTYVPNKNYRERNYRFPKKQYHQLLGDKHFNNFIKGICKPLTVALKNENLVFLKKECDKLKVKVKKSSKKQMKKHVCKEAKGEKKCIKQPKIVLVKKNISKIVRNEQIVKNKTALRKESVKNINNTKMTKNR